MAIKEEALEKFLAKHSMENRTKQAFETNESLRRKAERRRELVEQLMAEPWGRELWYDIIAEADILQVDPMTGNSQSFYIMGAQAVAKKNVDWIKKFHFNEWLLMEQEANRRRKEEEIGTSN